MKESASSTNRTLLWTALDARVFMYSPGPRCAVACSPYIATLEFAGTVKPKDSLSDVTCKLPDIQYRRQVVPTLASLDVEALPLPIRSVNVVGTSALA